MAKRLQDWFLRILPWKKRKDAAITRISEEEKLTRTLGRFEHYVVEVQKLLIWENPVYSLMSVILVNVLFWFVASFECSCYCFVCSALLVISACNFVMEKYLPHTSAGVVSQDWTPLHPSILTVPEISHYLSMAHCIAKDYYNWLRALRNEQPEVFCVGMCTFFMGLTLIGRALPGFLILYVLVMAVMLVPGACIYLLPESACNRLRALPAIFKPGNDSEEEYLPDQTGENLAFLLSADDPDSDKEEFEETNHFAESLTLDSEPADSSGTGTQTSFTTGVNVMPSHDDGSVDGLDESEFDLPAAVVTKPGNGEMDRRLDPEASDSDEDDVAGIQFQSSHFNGDSSEEEEKMAQGLMFPQDGNGRQREESSRGHSQSLGEMLTSTVVGAVAKNITSLGAMGQSLLSSVISSPSVSQTQTAKKDQEASSTDSDDFEMISEEDLS